MVIASKKLNERIMDMDGHILDRMCTTIWCQSLYFNRSSSDLGPDFQSFVQEQVGLVKHRTDSKTNKTWQ